MKFFNFLLAGATFLAYLSPYIHPEFFWPVIFFGLAYPAFLIGNLIFIIFWFFFKRKFVFISLITLFLGIGPIKSTFGLNFSTKKINPLNSEEVLSYNVQSFFEFGKKGKYTPEDRSLLLNFLKEEEIKVACFQEFVNGRNHQKTFSEEEFFRNFHSGNSRNYIGSEYKIIKSGFLDFNGNNRRANFADIKFNGELFRFYNLHLNSNKITRETRVFNFTKDLFSRKIFGYLRSVLSKYKNASLKRVESIQKIKHHIANSPHPVIVCTDLNDTPLSYTYRIISEGLKDAFTEKGKGWGKTYNGKIPGLRIDYIFVSPEIEVLDFQIIKNDFSDHYPLICKLKLNPD